MPLTNTILANEPYTLSHEGETYASGAETVVSVPVSSPAGNSPGQGRLTLIITNETSNVPLHVEMRTVVTDNNGVQHTVPLILSLFSNAQVFGVNESAVQVQGLIVLLSGQGMAIPLEGFVGSAVQVGIGAASDAASADVVCGLFQLWQN